MRSNTRARIAYRLAAAVVPLGALLMGTGASAATLSLSNDTSATPP